MKPKHLLNILAVALLMAITPFTAQAQPSSTPGLQWSLLHDLQYQVYAGINIGGASPIPLPAEIRKINSFNPELNLMIGTTITKWLGPDKRWGVAGGVRLEIKGMKTGATVKNYGMEIIQDGSTLSGNWTGKVKTSYKSNQITIPVTAVYKLNNRLTANLGPYISFAVNNDFNGHVYDGYLREGDPTGNKVSFEGDSKATYDFSDELRLIQYGAQLGVSWRAFRHLDVNANLTWGFNNIFKSSFKTITFNMYPIYLNFGFGYVF